MKSFNQLDHSQKTNKLIDGLKLAREMATNNPSSPASDDDIGVRAELNWIRLYKHDRAAALEAAEDLFAKPGRFNMIFSQRVHKSYERMQRQKVDLTRHPMFDTNMLAVLATSTSDSADSQMRDTTVKVMSRRYIKEMQEQPAATAVKALDQASLYSNRDISDLLTVIATQSSIKLMTQVQSQHDAPSLAKAGTELNKLMPQAQHIECPDKRGIWEQTFKGAWNVIADGIKHAKNGGGYALAVFSLSTYRQSAPIDSMQAHSAKVLNNTVHDLKDEGRMRGLSTLYEAFRNMASGRALRVYTGTMPKLTEGGRVFGPPAANSPFNLPVGEVIESNRLPTHAPEQLLSLWDKKQRGMRLN